MHYHFPSTTWATYKIRRIVLHFDAVVLLNIWLLSQMILSYDALLPYYRTQEHRGLSHGIVEERGHSACSMISACMSSRSLTVSEVLSRRKLMALFTSSLQSCRATMHSSWVFPETSISWEHKKNKNPTTTQCKVKMPFNRQRNRDWSGDSLL